MTYFSHFRTYLAALTGGLASFILLTASPLAFAQDEPVSLPDIAPEQIAQDSQTRYDERTGAKEIVAPTFDPFEAIDDLAGVASLRTVHENGKLSREGGLIHDGAILELSFFYTSASNDPLETRGFEKAEYLSGETVSSLRYDSAIRECSENVREVVYDDGYYRGAPYGYLGGVYTHYPHYRGHSHFGYGLIFGAYNYGYRRGYGHRYYGHSRHYGHSRRNHRVYGGRGHGRRGLEHGRFRDHDDRHADGRHTGGRRDGGRRNGHIRDGGRRDGDRREGRGPRYDRDNRPPVFVDRQPNRARGQGRNRVEGGRAGNARDRVRLLGDRPRFENAPDTSASRRTPATRAAGPRNRDIPARRNVQPRQVQPRVATPPRQSQRAIGRATDKTFRPKNRNIRNPKPGRQLDLFPVMAGTYGRSTVRVSYQCAREETLSLNIPQDRLDAARFDGFTVYVIDRDRNALPVYVPPNYVEGFRLATRDKANRYSTGSHNVGQTSSVTGPSDVRSKREPIIYGDPKGLAGARPEKE